MLRHYEGDSDDSKAGEFSNIATLGYAVCFEDIIMFIMAMSTLCTLV